MLIHIFIGDLTIATILLLPIHMAEKPVQFVFCVSYKVVQLTPFLLININLFVGCYSFDYPILLMIDESKAVIKKRTNHLSLDIKV